LAYKQSRNTTKSMTDVLVLLSKALSVVFTCILKIMRQKIVCQIHLSDFMSAMDLDQYIFQDSIFSI